jgi:hypothetical protein
MQSSYGRNMQRNLQLEKKLADQIATTKEAFLAAKVSSAKAHEAAGQVQEISDEEFGDLTSSTSGSAQKITDTMEDLNKSLATLQEQAMAVPEEEVHLAKRPRRKHPMEEDASMQEPAKEDSTELGKPFG